MKKNQNNCPSFGEIEGKNKKGVIKKIPGAFGFMASRFILLAIGIGIGIVVSIAIIRVHAAWDSHVFPGDTITAAGWNEIVDKLVDLENRMPITTGVQTWTASQAVPIPWKTTTFTCPADQVMVGIETQETTGDVTFEQIRILCAPLE